MPSRQERRREGRLLRVNGGGVGAPGPKGLILGKGGLPMEGAPHEERIRTLEFAASNHGQVLVSSAQTIAVMGEQVDTLTRRCSALEDLILSQGVADRATILKAMSGRGLELETEGKRADVTPEPAAEADVEEESKA